MKERKVKQTLFEIKNLSQAIIDSSTIIYLYKINIITLAEKHLKLYTVPEVISETNLNLKKIKILKPHNYEDKDKTDQLIIKLVKQKKLPVISEDKEILKAASRLGVPYFNSLMVICFFYFKNIITEEASDELYNKLAKVSHYSNFVWEYARSILNEIKREKINIAAETTSLSDLY